MTATILQVNNLSISFSAATAIMPAVKNISLAIKAGEIMAIVGESGSGKSVTALSIMQLLPAQASVKGAIIFSTQSATPADLLTLTNKQINALRGKAIAMIFQEPMTSLNPVLSCGYQVMEAIQLHQGVSRKIAREKTIALFEKVQLPNPITMVQRYPHQLSGGQKQRVMIAMAMSCNPALLIADEPTTALDVTVQQTILQLIKQLQRENGMAVLFITHDLGLVADIADSVAVMYQGEIIEQGSTSTILQNPQQAYTRALLACRPTTHQRGERLSVVTDFLTSTIDQYNYSNKIAVDKKEIVNVPPTENPSTKKAALKIILSVEKLKVYYPGKSSFLKQPLPPFKAVDEVSFTVSKGEIVGLVGESGCGKTTLGRAILQLIPVTSGSIILNEQHLTNSSKKQLQTIRKNLQIVFQDPYGSLNPRMMIGDAIMEPMRVHGLLNSTAQRKERVMELLKKVNLTAEQFNRYPHQFSGGQRQRICIARALALDPSFLIFDESVSALDVSVQAQVLNLLNDLKEEFGFTAIFISHDLGVVRYISDRILVMHQGKIVEQGLADDIYFYPQNEYTQKLIAAIPGKGLKK